MDVVDCLLVNVCPAGRWVDAPGAASDVGWLHSGTLSASRYVGGLIIPPQTKERRRFYSIILRDLSYTIHPSSLTMYKNKLKCKMQNECHVRYDELQRQASLSFTCPEWASLGFCCTLTKAAPRGPPRWPLWRLRT